jgi:hypothetical protein
MDRSYTAAHDYSDTWEGGFVRRDTRYSELGNAICAWCQSGKPEEQTFPDAALQLAKAD